MRCYINRYTTAYIWYRPFCKVYAVMILRNCFVKAPSWRRLNPVYRFSFYLSKQLIYHITRCTVDNLSTFHRWSSSHQPFHNRHIGCAEDLLVHLRHTHPTNLFMHRRRQTSITLLRLLPRMSLRTKNILTMKLKKRLIRKKS